MLSDELLCSKIVALSVNIFVNQFCIAICTESLLYPLNANIELHGDFAVATDTFCYVINGKSFTVYTTYVEILKLTFFIDEHLKLSSRIIISFM